MKNLKIVFLVLFGCLITLTDLYGETTGDKREGEMYSISNAVQILYNDNESQTPEEMLFGANPIRKSMETLTIEADIKKLKNGTDEFGFVGLVEFKRSDREGTNELRTHGYVVRRITSLNVGETKRIRISFATSNLEGQGYVKIFLYNLSANEQTDAYNTISNVVKVPITLALDPKNH